MQALAVIEHLDVLEAHGPHCVAGLESFAEQALILEAVEPTLGRCVILELNRPGFTRHSVAG